MAITVSFITSDRKQRGRFQSGRHHGEREIRVVEHNAYGRPNVQIRLMADTSLQSNSAPSSEVFVELSGDAILKTFEAIVNSGAVSHELFKPEYLEGIIEKYRSRHARHV